MKKKEENKKRFLIKAAGQKIHKTTKQTTHTFFTKKIFSFFQKPITYTRRYTNNANF
ncbi:MAG: hypothetical protein V1726_08460 [Methanobacteriota archaeon]